MAGRATCLSQIVWAYIVGLTPMHLISRERLEDMSCFSLSLCPLFLLDT